MKQSSPKAPPADAPSAAPAPAPASPLDFAPVPRKCARHDGWTPARQRAFIAALARTASVRAACAEIGMASEGDYQLRRQPGAESFAAAWDEALASRIDMLRDDLMDRALHGVEVPVMSYGKHIGTRRIYNDRTALHMLRNYDGQMAGGAAGLPLRMKRIVAEEVTKARAQWEAERENRKSEMERTQDVLAIVDRHLKEAEAAMAAEREGDEEAEPSLSEETRGFPRDRP